MLRAAELYVQKAFPFFLSPTVLLGQANVVAL